MLLEIILAFLIGSIPSGYLLNKYSGHGDIRKVGSGNIGATNVLRHSGKLLGLLTLLIDIGKGFFALVCLHLDRSEGIFIIGSSVVLGHIFSPWLKFKGGKGVATMLGVILFISMACYDDPSGACGYYRFRLDFISNIFFISVFSWLMIIFITRYVALGSVISLTIATIYSFFYIPSLFLFFVLITLLITYKHKDNFERIKNKTENKISF
jgi:glycerol-3-phosphate acyltransferase PlsY